MRMTRHAVTLAAGVAVCAFAPRLHAQVRIAVVDLQRVLEETEDGRHAKAQLKRLGQQLERDLDADQKQVKALKADLDSHPDWNAATKQQKEAELQAAFVALQQKYADAQRKLGERSDELTRPIVGRAQQVVQHLAQTEGYTVVLERHQSGVVWSQANLDITDVVIQRYNAGEGRAEATPAPAPRARHAH